MYFLEHASADVRKPHSHGNSARDYVRSFRSANQLNRTWALLWPEETYNRELRVMISGKSLEMVGLTCWFVWADVVSPTSIWPSLRHWLRAMPSLLRSLLKSNSTEFYLCQANRSTSSLSRNSQVWPERDRLSARSSRHELQCSAWVHWQVCRNRRLLRRSYSAAQSREFSAWHASLVMVVALVTR